MSRQPNGKNTNNNKTAWHTHVNRSRSCVETQPSLGLREEVKGHQAPLHSRPTVSTTPFPNWMGNKTTKKAAFCSKKIKTIAENVCCHKATLHHKYCVPTRPSSNLSPNLRGYKIIRHNTSKGSARCRRSPVTKRGRRYSRSPSRKSERCSPRSPITKDSRSAAFKGARQSSRSPKSKGTRRASSLEGVRRHSRSPVRKRGKRLSKSRKCQSYSLNESDLKGSFGVVFAVTGKSSDGTNTLMKIKDDINDIMKSVDAMDTTITSVDDATTKMLNALDDEKAKINQLEETHKTHVQSEEIDSLSSTSIDTNSSHVPSKKRKQNSLTDTNSSHLLSNNKKQSCVSFSSKQKRVGKTKQKRKAKFSSKQKGSSTSVCRNQTDAVSSKNTRTDSFNHGFFKKHNVTRMKVLNRKAMAPTLRALKDAEKDSEQQVIASSKCHYEVEENEIVPEKDSLQKDAPTSFTSTVSHIHNIFNEVRSRFSLPGTEKVPKQADIVIGTEHVLETESELETETTIDSGNALDTLGSQSTPPSKASTVPARTIFNEVYGRTSLETEESETSPALRRSHSSKSKPMYQPTPSPRLSPHKGATPSPRLSSYRGPFNFKEDRLKHNRKDEKISRVTSQRSVVSVGTSKNQSPIKDKSPLIRQRLSNNRSSPNIMTTTITNTIPSSTIYDSNPSLVNPLEEKVSLTRELVQNMYNDREEDFGSGGVTHSLEEDLAQMKMLAYNIYRKSGTLPNIRFSSPEMTRVSPPRPATSLSTRVYDEVDDDGDDDDIDDDALKPKRRTKRRTKRKNSRKGRAPTSFSNITKMRTKSRRHRVHFFPGHSTEHIGLSHRDCVQDADFSLRHIRTGTVSASHPYTPVQPKETDGRRHKKKKPKRDVSEAACQADFKDVCIECIDVEVKKNNSKTNKQITMACHNFATILAMNRRTDQTFLATENRDRANFLKKVESKIGSKQGGNASKNVNEALGESDYLEKMKREHEKRVELFIAKRVVSGQSPSHKKRTKRQSKSKPIKKKGSNKAVIKKHKSSRTLISNGRVAVKKERCVEQPKTKSKRRRKDIPYQSPAFRVCRSVRSVELRNSKIKFDLAHNRTFQNTRSPQSNQIAQIVYPYNGHNDTHVSFASSGVRESTSSSVTKPFLGGLADHITAHNPYLWNGANTPKEEHNDTEGLYWKFNPMNREKRQRKRVVKRVGNGNPKSHAPSIEQIIEESKVNLTAAKLKAKHISESENAQTSSLSVNVYEDSVADGNAVVNNISHAGKQSYKQKHIDQLNESLLLGSQNQEECEEITQSLNRRVPKVCFDDVIRSASTQRQALSINGSVYPRLILENENGYNPHKTQRKCNIHSQKQSQPHQDQTMMQALDRSGNCSTTDDSQPPQSSRSPSDEPRRSAGKRQKKSTTKPPKSTSGLSVKHQETSTQTTPSQVLTQHSSFNRPEKPSKKSQLKPRRSAVGLDTSKKNKRPSRSSSSQLKCHRQSVHVPKAVAIRADIATDSLIPRSTVKPSSSTQLKLNKKFKSSSSQKQSKHVPKTMAIRCDSETDTLIAMSTVKLSKSPYPYRVWSSDKRRRRSSSVQGKSLSKKNRLVKFIGESTSHDTCVNSTTGLDTETFKLSKTQPLEQQQEEGEQHQRLSPRRREPLPLTVSKHFERHYLKWEKKMFGTGAKDLEDETKVHIRVSNNEIKNLLENGKAQTETVDSSFYGNYHGYQDISDKGDASTTVESSVIKSKKDIAFSLLQQKYCSKPLSSNVQANIVITNIANNENISDNKSHDVESLQAKCPDVCAGSHRSPTQPMMHTACADKNTRTSSTQTDFVVPDLKVNRPEDGDGGRKWSLSNAHKLFIPSVPATLLESLSHETSTEKGSQTDERDWKKRRATIEGRHKGVLGERSLGEKYPDAVARMIRDFQVEGIEENTEKPFQNKEKPFQWKLWGSMKPM